MKRSIYYTLNFTWGIIMTLVGLICALCLTFVGKKADIFRGCLHFTVGKNRGGVSLGIVIITDDTPDAHTLKHEYGHTIQNALFGVFFPFIIGIPSALRYQKRKILRAKGVELEPYDAVWYEGQATNLGYKYID